MDGRHVTGYGATTSATSFDVTIDPGEAFIGEDDLRLVGDVQGAHGDADDSVVVTLTNHGSAGDTFHLYLKRDGNLEVNTTGTAPADSIKLWKFTTDSNGVTGTTDERSTLVNLAAAFEAEDLTARDQLTGERGKLDKNTDPEWVWTDGDDTYKIRLDSGSGKLQVLDGSDNVQTDDLSDISNPVDVTSTDTTKDKTVSNDLAKGWEDHVEDKNTDHPHPGHEDTDQKGTAGGYAGLDSNTLVNQAVKEVETRTSDPTLATGRVWMETDATRHIQYSPDGTAVEEVQVLSQKGVADGYAGLDSNSLVAQAAKQVRTTTPSGSTGGDIWVTSDSLKFRDSGATSHTVATESTAVLESGDTMTGLLNIKRDEGNDFLEFDDNTNSNQWSWNIKTDAHLYLTEQGGSGNTDIFDVDPSNGLVNFQTTPTAAGGTIWHDNNVTGGTDIVVGATSIDHADTSSQGNVSAAAGAAITDIDLDDRGHVTSISTTDFDGRFVNDGESPAAGDISGSFNNGLTIDTDAVGSSEIAGGAVSDDEAASGMKQTQKTYTGDGTNGRTISLPFHANVAIVQDMDGSQKTGWLIWGSDGSIDGSLQFDGPSEVQEQTHPLIDSNGDLEVSGNDGNTDTHLHRVIAWG